jgi:ribosomal protein S18 acetylase RimI-like enzyme
VEVSTVANLDAEGEAAFRRIYEQSFPASERAATDHVLADVATGGRLAYRAGSGRALLGFGVLLQLTTVDALLLEYLAVDPATRSRGVGSVLLGAIVADLRSRAQPPSGVVLEVEPAAGPPDEEAIRGRRIRFYEDNGATIVPGAPRYAVPDLTGGPHLPFTLMWLPVAGPSALEGDLLRRCVAAILADAYGLAGDDPLMRRVLAGLEP